MFSSLRPPVGLKFLLFSLSLNLFLSGVVFANEAAPPAAAKAEKNDSAPWQETLAQVRALKAQRGQALSNLNKVRQDMRHLKEGSQELKNQLAEYAKLYKEYREISTDYNQQLSILKYRYPDRLAKDQNRQYQTVEIESESELAQKLDLDSRLTNTVNKSRQQYADRSQEKQKSAVPSTRKNPEGPVTIREEEAILLSK